MAEGFTANYLDTSRIRRHLIWLARIQGDDFFKDKSSRGERQMLERLMKGETTKYDLEFLFHETIEAEMCEAARNLPDTPEGRNEALRMQAEAHRNALERRNVTERDLFHPDVIRSNPDIFGPFFR